MERVLRSTEVCQAAWPRLTVSREKARRYTARCKTQKDLHDAIRAYDIFQHTAFAVRPAAWKVQA